MGLPMKPLDNYLFGKVALAGATISNRVNQRQVLIEKRVA
jgi:hypothetical protein